MKKLRIIGLTGLEGAGKDSVAHVLLKNRLAFPIAFADPLRAEVAEAYSLQIHELTCRVTKEEDSERLALWRCTNGAFMQAVIATHPHIDTKAPQSPRQIMRWWGTEYRRAQDQQYWINAMRERLFWADGIPLPSTAIVVTDVRFRNEASLIRELGGQIWRVHRPDHSVDSIHISTVSGEEFAPDQTVINAGDLADLDRSTLHHWQQASLYWR
ncbi:deoxynucleotide monophosphate kinase family protein [Comamonas sediminis]|uniref:Deoxynucleotide monophosphate kinase n=1 Tax=Comamonas sediminis TaxID=1783360 RepID=A0ABV4B8S0_9BURK